MRKLASKFKPSTLFSHTPLNGKPASEWYGEMDGQRRILAKFANANENEIIGMRAPQLSVGGDEQLEVCRSAYCPISVRLCSGKKTEAITKHFAMCPRM